MFIFDGFMKKFRPCFLVFFLTLLSGFWSSARVATEDELYLHYIANPSQQTIRMFWKDDAGRPLLQLGNLKNYVGKQKRQLLFAMNGGMYLADHSPQGLFISEAKVLKTLDTKTGNGNFHLKPNGVFYITSSGKAEVVVTEKFRLTRDILYATQSGPMLLFDGKIHPEFKAGSSRVHIRNGVGILPNGHVLFAMSKKPVSMFDFATFFKSKGCKNALYLDGFVSRCYYPEKKWVQEDGDFGVMIGVLK